MYFRSAFQIHIMSLGANKVCIFPPVRGSWCGPQASFWSLSCLKPAFPRAEQARDTHAQVTPSWCRQDPGRPFCQFRPEHRPAGLRSHTGRSPPPWSDRPPLPYRMARLHLQHPETLTPGISSALSLVDQRHQNTLKEMLVPALRTHSPAQKSLTH